MRVLVAEDDADLRLALAAALRGAGFRVDAVAELGEADSALTAAAYDCVVLDQSLPGGDGVAYLRDRRTAGWTVPVLLLTSRAAFTERAATSAWAEELTKPFALPELVVRVRSLARRSVLDAAPPLRVADLEIDRVRREAHRAGVPLGLTEREFTVLELLAARPGQAMTRTELLAHLPGDGSAPGSNVLDVLVAQLRRKLGPPALIQTVRGVGYRLTVEFRGPDSYAAPAAERPGAAPAAGPAGSTPAAGHHGTAPAAGRGEATDAAGRRRAADAAGRRRSSRRRAFLDGLAMTLSFGMSHSVPPGGLTDAAVANVAAAARRVGRAGADG
jgi:two-component system, OmpR family, response regulator